MKEQALLLIGTHGVKKKKTTNHSFLFTGCHLAITDLDDSGIANSKKLNNRT